MNKKLMILGASYSQLHLYEAAKKLGISTVAVSTHGDWPGFQVADESSCTDISDPQSVCKAAKELKADGIAIFSIHPDNGMLAKAGYQLTGIHPRNFIITPNGKYLLVACRDSNVIQVYERDADTGLLTDVQQDIKVDKPVCIKFVP